MTITEFLLARIAEDEEGADRVEVRPYVGEEVSQSLRVRVLAEMTAKRNLIQLHRQDGDAPWCMEGCGMRAGGPEWPCDTLYWMAGVYADHPDYQDDWA